MIDRNVTPNHEIPKWSETRWNGCWCPESGVGIYTHMGRVRKDRDLWWAQTVAYLPDGRLAVDHTYGRTTDDRFVTTGPFTLEVRDEGWHSTFDGAAQLTTTEQLAAGVQGAGAPTAPMKWDVSAAAFAPTWDMYAGQDDRHSFAGDTHLQQTYTTSGTLTVDGVDYDLTGIGYKDHSSGTRAWDGYGHHAFICAVMPTWSMHAIMLFTPDGVPRGPIGSFFFDGEQVAIEQFEIEPIGDAEGGPNAGEITVKPAGREPITLGYDVLAQCPISINDDGDNLNGIDWGSPAPSVVIMEGAARLTETSGTVGYCFHERGMLLDSLIELTSANSAAVVA